MSNRILVLGATGNLGSLITQNLQKSGADFIGGALDAAEMSKLKQKNVQGVTLDFNDPASLDKAMRGISYLFMLTPATEKMVSWGTHIIAAAKRNNIQFIVRSSIMDTNPDSQHLLFKMHGQVDQKLRASGIPHAIVQPGAFMQNFVYYWANSINNNNAFYSMHGDYRVSYIDLRDVAAIETEILANPALQRNMEYTITGPESLSDIDVSRTLSKTTGRTIRNIPCDESQYAAELRKMGMSEWNIKLYLSLERRVMEGSLGLISEEKPAITGKTPITFEQFARDYAQEWKKAKVSV